MPRPKVIAFVPAKSSSDRVPSKNMLLFNGEPLFLYTVRKLLRCEFIDKVYVDSDSQEILDLAIKAGALPMLRDPTLASNATDGHALFYNEVQFADADIYIQHLCTSPFIKTSTIESCVKELSSDNEIDSLILASRSKQYTWKDGKPSYPQSRIPNSIELPETICESMGLYVVSRGAALSTKRRIGLSPKLIFGSPVELVDINNEDDIELAKLIAAGYQVQEATRLRTLAQFLTSSLLSDIFDEMGIKSILPPIYTPNHINAKMFGRARTLHIRKQRSPDPENSIYKALEMYSKTMHNDIIVVQNDVQNLAYFGDLNMALAIRSGAIGALIGGVTRDSVATSSSGFPVFSKGNYCRDIKSSGSVASINGPITLDEVPIRPNDLIFADRDGVAIIPQENEAEIINRSIKTLQTEINIRGDICSDHSVTELLQRHGHF